ncbi:hypothetical protein J2Z50_002636 [Ensifer mexicanus]|nr:hypothetical protein [Sinorhizobium mexicanum]
MRSHVGMVASVRCRTVIVREACIPPAAHGSAKTDDTAGIHEVAQCLRRGLQFARLAMFVTNS